ncbi:MAG: hypothetical protein P1U68_17280 [Verrucomicrobiales bacterium]|nr:hypothetical protein [Verrucomicrobiales bacterium]
MKIPSLILFTASLSAGVLTVTADEIPAEAEEVIAEAVSAAVPHFDAALAIATEGGDDPRDFTALAKSLAARGLGKTPALPPWVPEESEGSGEEAEHYREEWESRVQQLGKTDLKYLKGADIDQDLKTDSAEMEKAVKGYLGFLVEDKLNVDGNGDNRLTLQEYALAVPARGEKDEDGVDWHQRGHFEESDADGDGFLDVAEMLGHDVDILVKRSLLAHLVLTIPVADSDGDGVLSESEFLARSGATPEVWAEISRGSDQIALDELYPAFYWVSNENLATLLP